MRLAKEYNCTSVAFPLISSGVYGYPKDEALRVAIDSISAFLVENEMLVYIVVFDKSAYKISEKLFLDISSYIDDNYVAEHSLQNRRLSENYSKSVCMPSASAAAHQQALPDLPCKCTISLEDAVKGIDESFSQMLLRKIDEKGMTDAQCYKKANIDRKLFSKIRSDLNYKPSKPTAIAFAVALELDLEQTKDMLMKAGFALSHSNVFDIIIEYFITNKNYNIFEINEALFEFDQSLLGS